MIRFKKKTAKKKRVVAKKKKKTASKRVAPKKVDDGKMQKRVSSSRAEINDTWADITDLFAPPTKQKDAVFTVVTRAHPAIGSQVWAVDILRYGPSGGNTLRSRKGVGCFQFYLNIDVIDTPEGLGMLIDWLKNNKRKLMEHAKKTVARKDRGGK